MNSELLIRCKNQDRIAQRQVYEQFAGKLFTICKRYIKNEEDIEEVLGDTFYIIFTKIDQLKNIDVFEAWAKKIAVNNCLQNLRKKEKLQIYIEDTFLEKTLAAEDTSFSSEKDIMSMLNFLPEGCRTIFNLFVIEGYPHKEIAEMLSISEGTSKSQVNFARKKLQELLQLQEM